MTGRRVGRLLRTPPQAADSAQLGVERGFDDKGDRILEVIGHNKLHRRGARERKAIKVRNVGTPGD